MPRQERQQPLAMTDRPEGWQPTDEDLFKRWYSRASTQFKLDPNPDDPRQQYNYRHAFKAGAWGDAQGHWPSEYKAAGHPNRFVGGMDTATGRQMTIRDYITQEAEKLNIPGSLALAMVDQESNGSHTAPAGGIHTSSAGARGFFQLMPDTAASLGVNPDDPFDNIRGGLQYLKQQIDANDGDVRLGLAAYNAGPGRVVTGGQVPDIAETQNYVQSILTRWQQGDVAAPAPLPRDTRRSTPPPAAATAGMLPVSTARPVLPADDPSSIPPAHRFLAQMTQAGLIEPTTGIVALARGMWDDPAATAAAIAKGVGMPFIEGLQEATAARQRGDVGGWVRGMVKAIPLYGPVADEIWQSVEEGDYAGGAGRATGTALTFFVPKALRSVRATKQIGPVPLLRAERTPGGLTGFATSLVERTTPGARVFARFREKQQVALQAEGERLAAQISSVPKSPASDVGINVRSMIAQSQADHVKAASQIYDMIDAQTASVTKRVPVTSQVPSMIVGPQGEPLTVPKRTLKKVDVGGVQPETTVLKRVAIPMLRKLKQEEKIIHPEELARTRRILTQIIESPKTVPFSAMQAARSSLLGIVRSHGDPIPGKAGGAAKLLAGEVDDAMMTAAQQSGIPDLPNLVRHANELWRETKSIYNAPFLKNIGQASPEVIPALIQHADVAELQLLQQALPPKTWNAARAHLLREMMAEATDPPPTPTASTFSSKFGVTPGGKPPTTATPRLAGKRITAALRRLGPEKAERLFGKAGVDGLDDLAAVADLVQPGNVNIAATGLVAAGINASILAPFVGPVIRPSMFLNPAALAVASAYSATAYASLNTLARLLTKPEGLTTYRRFLRSLSTGNRPAVMAAGGRLAALTQEAMAEDNDLLTAPQWQAGGLPPSTMPAAVPATTSVQP